jgi:hypothetical protein
MKIIVARYNEKINWTKQLKNVLIYNKGKCISPDEYNYKQLKNIGREGHTYYQYIYDNYDYLDNYTAFVQGNPFDHSPNLIKQITNFSEQENIQFHYLSNWKIKCNITGCKYYNPNRRPNMMEVYEMLFDKKVDNLEWVFGAGAQFIVSKKAIYKKPKEFYRKIINLLESKDTVNIGYIIERFHPLIFNVI